MSVYLDRGQTDGESYCLWRALNPEPSLQVLAERHGCIGNVPLDEWTKFDQERARWRARYLARWSRKW